MKDYWILVMPTPWRWLSLALFVLTIALYSWILWRQRRVRREFVRLCESMIDACHRSGVSDLAEQFQGHIAAVQRKPRWITRREADRQESAA